MNIVKSDDRNKELLVIINFNKNLNSSLLCNIYIDEKMKYLKIKLKNLRNYFIQGFIVYYRHLDIMIFKC